MPDHWEETTWGQAVELKYGKAIRGYQDANEAYPVFGTNGQVGTHSQFLAEGPGVILGRKGAYRGVHYSKQPFFVIDTAYYVDPKQELDMRWLYYAMQHYKIGQIDDGSPIPSTTRAAVYTSEFKRPPIDEQRDIAACLGSLDDKIELNRRMNETLEEMARALFRDWFVDFGPTRRQMEGATDPAAIMGGAFPAGDMPAEVGTGSASNISTTQKLTAAALAPLFPAKLGDDGLPEGWEEGSLADYGSIKNGFAFKSKDWRDEGVPVIKIKNVKPRLVSLHGAGFIEPELALEKSRFQLQVGDMLVGMTGYVGEVGRVPETSPLPMLNQRVGHICAVYRKGFSPFLFSCTRQPEFKEHASARSHGSAQANVSAKDLGLFDVPTNCLGVVSMFDEFATPLFERMQIADTENQTLAEMRDLLLPKLMSGEIRLKDVEVGV